MSSLRTLIAAALCSIGLTAAAQANANNVYVSRFWHNHQPIYWPEWNNNNGGQDSRVQYAWDSIVKKPTQNYGGLSPAQHPENNLTDIFGLDDRRNAYQQGPRNSVAGIDSRGGFAISYSGSLIDNVRQLGGGGHLGYGGNWNAGFREARGWKTPSGSTRMDLLGFTYHHSLAPLLPKSVFRKELQIFKQAWWKAWGGNSDLSDHSKGFFPTEMAYSRHLIDVLVDEGYEWTIVPSHHISRTCPTYMNDPNDTSPETGAWKIYSSPPNKADQLGPSPTSGWWYGMPNPGNAARNVSPYAYQLHRVKYVNPETGQEKRMYAVPSDDVLSYRYGYANEGIGKINDYIATNANVPVIVMPATDGDNAWGGGSSSWFEATPQFFSESAKRGYKPSAPQDFVNAVKSSITSDTHIEDGAWIFPEMDYGSPYFLKWIEPPVATVANRGKTTHPGTQIDMETPGFALKFFSYAPLMAGANWCETAEQILRDENGGNDLVNEWKIATPYDWDGSWTSPNDVELAWHIYLAGLDSGFNYYGGLGNDDEAKPALATKNAIDKLQNFMTPDRKAKDKTGPTVLKPQRFPYNPGAYTFGWFNNEPHINNGNFLKKMPSWFYIWTHAYDLNGIPDGNVKLKVRIDKDGNNSPDSNQNETYAGGTEVGGWIEIPMTKRVLPKTRTALNAAAANGQIDYFVFDPAFWPNPVIADYYFAKIDDTSLPNFRDKLLDYYVEATDGKGNTHKSEIQHVWVANDGIVPSSGVQFSANPSDCEPITVTYTASNGPLENKTPVTMQISFDNGTTWTPYEMSSVSANVWAYTISAPNNAPSAVVWFESGGVTDSRNGQNWSVSIRDCAAPTGPVWTVPFTPLAGQEVTVYYNPLGRNLASATKVNIHHGFNENITANWTAVPGVSMTKDGSNWKYTYTVPAKATIVRYVFNNATNTWDNNGGGDWNIDVTSQPPATNPPAAPTGLTNTAISSSSISLSWNAAETATGYLLFRNGNQIAAPQDRNYVDTGLSPETTYTYFVRATNAIGPSTNSASISVTTPFAPVPSSSIVVTDPTSLLQTSSENYTFRGRAGGGFASGLSWTNATTGSNGLIPLPGGSTAGGWAWTAAIPLSVGSNSVSFSGLIQSAATQTLADSPTNYVTWTNESTAGQGFGVWYFNHSTNNAGSFLADGATNMNVGTTKGFGLWANNGGRAAVTRGFNTPMKSGDSFNVKFDNNWIENGAEVGMELRDSFGTVRFRFFFVGGESTYRVADAQSNRPTSIAYTDRGLDLTLMLGASNAYTFKTGTGEFTGNLKGTNPIAWMEFFNNNAGTNTERNVYLGPLTHSVATTTNQIVTTSALVVRSAGYTDGIPDTWWNQYFGTTNGVSASADPDVDGLTNAQEYAAGTHPKDPASAFRITSIVREGTNTTVHWSAAGQKTYQLQASPNLSSLSWSNAGAPVSTSPDQTNASAVHGANAEQHFYKVNLVQ